VQAWLEAHGEVIEVAYKTNEALDYVPNLRAQFNRGFEAGFAANDYVAIVNTDMAFGINWLRNLVRRASEDVIPNSLHISPIKGPNIVTANLGIPTEETFDALKFWNLHNELYAERVETEEERGGWRATNTMPYVIHRKWWERCGPWETEFKKGEKETPDRRFFHRCHEAGARHVLCHDSICYHHEAVERRTSRPKGTARMKEGR
jgi:hypothetical protein